MQEERREKSRTVARPIHGASWHERCRDVSEITDRLNSLWRRYAEMRQTEAVSPNGPVREGPWPMMTARATTLNLVAATRSKAEAARVRRTVASLSDVYPSRATILIADPSREDSGDGPGLDVHVDLLEHEASRWRSAIVYECITVDVSSENERQLASIASPLLVPDLPDFFWWARTWSKAERSSRSC